MTSSRTADQALPVESQLGIPGVDTLVLFHDIELKRSGGLASLRDEGLLASAVASVVNAMSFDPEMDQVDAAAKLAFGIMKNHSFADGNKRTAFGAAEMTLKEAGYEIVADPEEIADAVVDFAANARDYSKISNWLRQHIVVALDHSLSDEPAALKPTHPAPASLS